MKAKTKAELLEHYAKTDPKAFDQWDGWLNVRGDEVIGCDEDGHGVTGIETWELMGRNDWKVRVLVTPDTSTADAVGLLRKMANHIESYARFRKAKRGDPENLW